MGLDDPPHEGQAQAQAPVGPRLRAVQLVEVREDLRDVLGRDPDPFVRDADLDGPDLAAALIAVLPARPLDRQGDRSSLRRELHGVIDDLFERPTQEPFVPYDLWQLGVDIRDDRVAWRALLPVRSQLLDDRHEVHGSRAW